MGSCEVLMVFGFDALIALMDEDEIDVCNFHRICLKETEESVLFEHSAEGALTNKAVSGSFNYE